MTSRVDLFESALRRELPEAAGIRPFVCEGSPLDCNVFIVGCNPATDTDIGFWHYWRPGYGFDKVRWAADYRSVRLSRGEREMSNTRRAINVLVESCAPLRCLETNVYAKATRRQADLTHDDSRQSLLAFLVAQIRPQWIIAHGRIATTEVAQLAFDGMVLSGKHLRLRSHDELRRIGETIRQR